MTVQITVEVENEQQAKDLAAGLQRPDVHAFVVSMGALSAISHDRARARILTFLTDYVADPDNARVNRFAPVGKRT